MKAFKASVGRSIDQPDPKVRFYLLHGPDNAQSRALGERLVAALGASRYLIAAGSVKSDPATLADEAGAMSLFGGRRVIWIEPAGDEIGAGVEALMEANSVESPVVVIAGPLRKASALLKLAESSPAALAYAAHLPEGADAERMVTEVGRRVGLKISAPIAARIAESAENDQAIVFQELQKLALYLDASPEGPKELDAEAIDSVGTELSEGDVPRVADLALAGELADLADQLALLPRGAEGIPIVRALQRRLLQVAPARARIERGERPNDVMASLGKSLFWKDKALVQRFLSLWDANRLATISERTGRLERDLMFSPAPPHEVLGEELMAIARAARRR